MISPRQLFQVSLKPDSTFRSVMKSDEMERAIAFSLAQFATGIRNSDELNGAKAFIDILLGIADPEKAPGKEIDAGHKLDHSVFPVVEHALEKPKK